VSHSGTVHDRKPDQPDVAPAARRPGRVRTAGWLLAAAGGAALVTVIALQPAAAGQDWQPFVLVAGLLLIGLVADQDGLFEAGGHRIARLAPGGKALFCGAAVLIAVVTALLSLDTAVARRSP